MTTAVKTRGYSIHGVYAGVWEELIASTQLEPYRVKMGGPIFRIKPLREPLPIVPVMALDFRDKLPKPKKGNRELC